MAKFFLILFLLVPGRILADPVAELQPYREALEKRVQEAQHFAQKGEMDQAIQILESLAKEVPHESMAVKIQYDLANLLFLQGRYREARAAYHRVIQLAEDQQLMVQRSRERIGKMKERETQKKDEVALQLIDVETAVDLGQLPPAGSKDFLKKIGKDPESSHRERAGRLLEQIASLENSRAAALLNEARRLFDTERKYDEVLALLDQLEREFPESEEMESVRILRAEAERRLRRTPVPLKAGR